ncbi:hypothetical protein COV61_04260 [Candidatus Micrarchaeota archaeon CG11_big_fil_rev_8_21_14_0_20_47_5]|nr:MAG: hypothetical protein AUJ17_00455 [Candidatus Micrarchaeota archaeon CG1_02_47_40]PIN83033.1 MAG: hypothetical protein COV61_04260 [Candidatus Micrarchaeota archaeon CG11_big_fil_rev_8_21_14_0_20_47_5]
MNSDLILYSIKGLRYRALRSWLTILGVVIGIAVIILLVSLGQGITNSINKELDAFGSNTMIIMPGSQESLSEGGGPAGQGATKGKMYKNDMDRLGNIGGIGIMSPFLYGVFGVSYKGETASITITGIEPENYMEIYPNLKLAKGRLPKDGDRHVIAIGNKIAYELFKNDLEVNSAVKIREQQFRVVGIFEPTGGTFDDTDTSVFAPFEDVEGMMSKSLSKGEIAGVLIGVKKGYDVGEVQKEVEFAMRNSHKVKEGEEDFMVITSDFIAEQIGAITGLLTAFLGAIAAISLVVGGVTVSNTMFMSVLERVKEIGTLKAIGANRKDIMDVFLFESAAIGFLGGAIGIAFGLGLVGVLLLFDVPAAPSLELVAFCAIFSVLLGAVSGYIPARQAAGMNAVEAMRYE